MPFNAFVVLLNLRCKHLQVAGIYVQYTTVLTLMFNEIMYVCCCLRFAINAVIVIHYVRYLYQITAPCYHSDIVHNQSQCNFMLAHLDVNCSSFLDDKSANFQQVPSRLFRQVNLPC